MKISMVSSYKLSSCYKDVDAFHLADELWKLKACFLCRLLPGFLKCCLDLSVEFCSQVPLSSTLSKYSAGKCRNHLLLSCQQLFQPGPCLWHTRWSVDLRSKVSPYETAVLCSCLHSFKNFPLLITLFVVIYDLVSVENGCGIFNHKLTCVF